RPARDRVPEPLSMLAPGHRWSPWRAHRGPQRPISAARPPCGHRNSSSSSRCDDQLNPPTKLSLKNEVDDLLERFRTFHEGRGGTTLAKLRENYDLLVLKVVALLQDKDSALARDISTSREALWDLLKDPVKFKTL